MPKATLPTKPTMQTVPKVVDVPHAPVIYFDEAPNFGSANGIVNATLAIYRHLPDGNGGVAVDLVIVGHLRCSIPGAMALRTAIDQALLIAAPTPDNQVN